MFPTVKIFYHLFSVYNSGSKIHLKVEQILQIYPKNFCKFHLYNFSTSTPRKKSINPELPTYGSRGLGSGMSAQDSDEDLEHRDMEAIESHRMDLLAG
jgi:hypothetical protein